MARVALVGLFLLTLSPLVLNGQKAVAGFIETMPTGRLKQLFPRATAFTPRGEVDPIYFKAYAADPAAPSATPVGYAFWTRFPRPQPPAPSL